MAREIKYEKIDSNNIRRWVRDSDIINKQILQGLKSDHNFIINMSDTILEKINFRNSADLKEDAQKEVDKIDILLDLLNNSTTEENINFINE